jgi:hypothetical protein
VTMVAVATAMVVAKTAPKAMMATMVAAMTAAAVTVAAVAELMALVTTTTRIARCSNPQYRQTWVWGYLYVTILSSTTF